MKKANKKISKLLKITLLLCMIFSQLASPIETLASEIVPSYNIDMMLDTENDKFIVTSNGTRELVEDENYILEITRSFVYTDGTTNETENKTTYNLVLGSLLNTGVDIEHETFSYNGVSYIDVNVYEIVTEDTIDFSTYTEEVHQTLLNEEKIVSIMETSFEENVSYNETSVMFEVVGDSVVCDNTEGYKCSVTKNDTNNIVSIYHTIKMGNFNPNKNYYIALKVNGVVSDYFEITEGMEIDFSKMLPGVYNIEYLVRDLENTEIISNSIEFTYKLEEEIVEDNTTDEDIVEDDTAQDETISDNTETKEEFDRVEFIKNSELSVELFYSYTILTDEEKNTLGNDYRFLDSPLTFIFDTLISTKDNGVVTNYNLFNNDTRYHVVLADKLLGAFSESNNTGSYTVSEILELLNVDLPQITIYVVDANGQAVDGSVHVQNGMKLVVNILGEIFEYDFLVHGDVDGGYVEKSDLSTLIDKVLNNNLSYYDTYNLDLNGDNVIDVKDISVLGVNIYDQDYTLYEFSTLDTINSVIVSDVEELYAGESFEVLLSLNGFNEDYINAIEGIVNYDNEALSLDKVEVLNETYIGNYFNNRFIYASTETYATNDESFIKLTFTGLTEGVHKISVADIKLVADGVLVLANNSNELEIKVNRPLHTDASLKSLTSSVGYFNIAFNSDTLDYILYVDSSINYVTFSGELNDEYATTTDLKQYMLTGDRTYININVTAEDGTIRTYRVSVIKIYKSSNNNLSDIVIDGYDIEFDKNTLEYKITVGPDVNSLDISAIVEDYSAWAKIEGNENFQEGENVVTITVYAENGSTKTYKLIVNKEKTKTIVVDEDDDTEDESNINVEKIVIIVLIILVVIGLIYLIFKKDDEEGPRIEQIKPKKENNNKPEEVKHNNKNKKKNKK